tara:strand:- start:30 stop:713 length:684 start_codon:yes stop_codon:yes gene_type:complete
MLQLIDRKNRVFLYFVILILLSSINNKNFLNDKRSFLLINNINVTGLSNEENIKVAKSLSSFLNKNIFFINKEDIKKILLRNNLIELFNVKKKYPNSINIDVKKTDFLAITLKNNQSFFIGSNGKLIKYNDLNKTLPFVFGKLDYKNFVNFKSIIDNSEFEFDQIESLYFFPSNRWDIKTIDGIEIKLPEKNLLKALTIAHKIKNSEDFNKNKIIDLRISDNIIVTP